MVSAKSYRKWHWFLTTALALGVLSLAAQAEIVCVDERPDRNANEATRGGVVYSDPLSLVDAGILAGQRVIHVDANAPGDPSPHDPTLSDPSEDGTPEHPFDSVFEAMAVASDGDTVLVAPGAYAPVDTSNRRLEFAGRNIRLRSTFEEYLTCVEDTVLNATIVFDGTEGSDCELAGFTIQGDAFEGISGNGTTATLRYCVIQGNHTCDGSVLTDFHGQVANCLIADNTSAFECGSRPVVADFSGTMINCTIANNATGISVDTAEIANCIFYYNGIRTIHVQESLVASHCNIQGGEQAIEASQGQTLELAAIMALYPRFAKLGVWRSGRLEEGDYHLKSQGLRWSPEATADSHWVRDTITSPCIDGGDPSHDIGDEAVAFAPEMGVQSQVNWRINMGCYGGTSQASLPFVDRIAGITATASSFHENDTGPKKTCNGSGLDAQDQHSTLSTTMWLSDSSDDGPWILYEFNRTYVLYEMWVWNYNTMIETIIGYGVKDAVIECSEDGANWTSLGRVQFAQATAKADYTANTIVDLGGISARYVRFAVQSNWGGFDQVGLSEVRFFADLTPHSEPTLSYALVLDNFETYTDNMGRDEAVFQTWTDGWENRTGSTVGYLAAPFAEQWIVNSGLQSMPLFYANQRPPFYSEAYRDLDAGMRDWLIDDVYSLTLYFHGSPDSAPATETDRLYVAVQDEQGRIAVAYHSDPETLQSDDWQEWTIGLDRFGNVDLRHVERLILGIGNRADPQSGGSGLVYIDDIGLSVNPAQTDALYPISNVVATSNAPSEEDDSGPENTVNGSGLNVSYEHSTISTDMWLAKMSGGPVHIQFQFDDVYELQEMWVWNYNSQFEAILGFGVKDATIEYSVNGTDWTLWGDTRFHQAPAAIDYVADNIVEFDGVSARYVRLTINSGYGMLGQVGLSEVLFFTPQVPPSTAWSYMRVLDSFETYTADGDPNQTLREVWIDGWLNGTGSQVGYPPAPFTEREIVNSGLQALPLRYDNRWAPYYSEAYRDLEAGMQDWLSGDAEAVTLYFHGSPDKDHNTETDRLYIAVEDDVGRIAVVHHPTPEVLLSDEWHEWTVRFEEFGALDLSRVRRLYLGIGDRNNPQPGGRSVVYIDDIGLSTRVLGIGAGL